MDALMPDDPEFGAPEFGFGVDPLYPYSQRRPIEVVIGKDGVK